MTNISKKKNFPTLFFEHEKPSFDCSYQKIVQVELTSANRKFAYHITIYIFFKTIKILIHLYYLLHEFVFKKQNYLIIL
jgi:hypothetical protein